MDKSTMSHRNAGVIAWLVEFSCRGLVPGERRHLTFHDASQPDYWGGQMPPDATVTQLVAATENAAPQDVLARLVQHPPLNGRSRYLTFLSPTHPEFWVERPPGETMITELVALDNEPVAIAESVGGNPESFPLPLSSSMEQTSDPAGLFDGIANETTDQVMRHYFEPTSGMELKNRIRASIVTALERVAGLSRQDNAAGAARATT